jgi:hypothetical protein
MIAPHDQIDGNDSYNETESEIPIQSLSPGTAGTGDVIVAGLHALIPRLAAHIPIDIATEVVDWLCALHDRLLAAEAEIHCLSARVTDLELMAGGVPS